VVVQEVVAQITMRMKAVAGVEIAEAIVAEALTEEEGLQE
jgi:hypothetical protein